MSDKRNISANIGKTSEELNNHKTVLNERDKKRDYVITNLGNRNGQSDNTTRLSCLRALKNKFILGGDLI